AARAARDRGRRRQRPPGSRPRRRSAAALPRGRGRRRPRVRAQRRPHRRPAAAGARLGCPPMAITTANDVDLWAEQEGEGDDVLFISGLADEGACWVDQVAGLKDRYRVTTFDNRGVGRSSTPDGPFRIADFAADTAALIDALALERPHVVGSSMGGAIA